VARPELGAKRVCPVTGRKFYDLNRDPIVSPYTGITYARAIFEPRAKVVEAENDDEEQVEAGADVELVSLEDAEATTSADDSAVVVDVDVDAEADEDLGEDDTDLFVEEEEGDDDVADLIDGDIETDEET
jgi:uncharacterized protein (TIGR02300 family)